MACVCFEKFLFNFVITLVYVLKNVTKLFLKTVLKCVSVKRVCFEQASNNYLLVLEKFVRFLFSFRQFYHTISE